MTVPLDLNKQSIKEYLVKLYTSENNANLLCKATKNVKRLEQKKSFTKGVFSKYVG